MMTIHILLRLKVDLGESMSFLTDDHDTRLTVLGNRSRSSMSYRADDLTRLPVDSVSSLADDHDTRLFVFENRSWRVNVKLRIENRSWRVVVALRIENRSRRVIVALPSADFSFSQNDLQWLANVVCPLNSWTDSLDVGLDTLICFSRIPSLLLHSVLQVKCIHFLLTIFTRSQGKHGPCVVFTMKIHHWCIEMVYSKLLALSCKYNKFVVKSIQL